MPEKYQDIYKYFFIILFLPYKFLDRSDKKLVCCFKTQLRAMLKKDRNRIKLTLGILVPFLVAHGTSGLGSQVNVHIGAFFPLSHNVSEGAIGRGVRPAVKLAAKHINSSPLILKDYRLVVQYYDTMVSTPYQFN